MQNIDLFRIDGHTLRVFISVCETGSISRTADIFGLNQSTISHTIEKMRSAIGDPLFVKTGRQITPSEKALAIAPRVQQILSDIEGLVATEDYDAALDARPFIVAIPTPALLTEVRTLSIKLAKEAPQTRLEVRRLAPRSRIVEMLTRDEAEMAIAVSGVRYPSSLDYCAFGSDELVVFFDGECREPIQTVEDYVAARHAVVDFGGGVKSEIEKRVSELGLTREVALVAPTASMLGDLIRGSNLIATMPKGLSRNAYRSLSYVPPPFELSKIQYELVWHRRYENSGRHLWLRNMILEVREAGTI